MQARHSIFFYFFFYKVRFVLEILRIFHSFVSIEKEIQKITSVYHYYVFYSSKPLPWISNRKLCNVYGDNLEKPTLGKGLWGQYNINWTLISVGWVSGISPYIVARVAVALKEACHNCPINNACELWDLLEAGRNLTYFTDWLLIIYAKITTEANYWYIGVCQQFIFKHIFRICFFHNSYFSWCFA